MPTGRRKNTLKLLSSSESDGSSSDADPAALQFLPAWSAVNTGNPDLWSSYRLAPNASVKCFVYHYWRQGSREHFPEKLAICQARKRMTLARATRKYAITVCGIPLRLSENITRRRPLTRVQSWTTLAFPPRCAPVWSSWMDPRRPDSWRRISTAFLG